MGCHLKSFPHFPQPIWNIFHFTAAARTGESPFRLLQKINSPEKAQFFNFLDSMDVVGCQWKENLQEHVVSSGYVLIE